MKSIHFNNFAAFVGIDWADRKHDICMQCAGHDQREASQIQHTPQAISAWVKMLQQRFRQQPIAVCCELSKGPLIYALAFKWIRIMFRCWQQRCCYNETKYLNALKEKRSPLLQFAVS